MMHLAVSLYPKSIPPSFIRRHKRHVDPQRCRRPRASSPTAADFEAFILSTQASIIKTTQSLETTTKSFIQDRWEREGPTTSGYGITAVVEGGSILEKAAVNISVIHGTLTPERAKAMSTRGRSNINPEGGDPYHAVALSLVFHTANPHIPTLRADIRLFEAGQRAWYGGGCDLTPFYLYKDDARNFHRHWKRICDKYSTALYPDYKQCCDRYFYIPCRKEHRGLGGIFFDDLDSTADNNNNNNNNGQMFDAASFVKDVGTNILPSWLPIVEARRNTRVTDEQREWQLERRGRYLEFNLLYDRGVKFGLEGGRIESIMVSAPPLISWRYKGGGEDGGGGGSGASGEERGRREALLEVLRQPREWV